MALPLNLILGTESTNPEPTEAPLVNQLENEEFLSSIESRMDEKEVSLESSNLAKSKSRAQNVLADPRTQAVDPALRQRLERELAASRGEFAYHNDEQVKKGWGEKFFLPLQAFNPVTGPTALTAVKIWREAGRPGIPTSLDELGATASAIGSTRTVNDIKDLDPVTIAKALPGIGTVARAGESAASIVDPIRAYFSGDTISEDPNETNVAATTGQVFSTLQRPFANFATEAQQQEYLDLQLNESKRFNQLIKSGATPNKDGSVVDPKTGDKVFDRVFVVDAEGKPISRDSSGVPSKMKEGDKRFFATQDPFTGKVIRKKTIAQVALDSGMKLDLPNSVEDDSSFVPAMQLFMRNHGSTPGIGTVVAGIAADMIADPGNMLSFGNRSASQAGTQVARIMEEAFRKSGVEQPKLKSRALGNFVAATFSRSDRVPSDTLVKRAIEDPVQFQDTHRLLSMREVNYRQARGKVAVAERELAEAEELGVENLEPLKKKVESAQKLAAQTQEDLIEVHRKVGGPAYAPYGEEHVTTKQDVLRTLANGARILGEAGEEAARKIEALGSSWGKEGLIFGVGPFKKEVFSTKESGIADHFGEAMRAFSERSDSKVPSNIGQAVADTAQDLVEGISEKGLKKTLDSGHEVATSAAKVMFPVPVGNPRDYHEVLQIADALNDRFQIRRAESLRTASDLATKAKRSPKELESVYTAISFPYQRAEERSTDLISKFEIDPSVPSDKDIDTFVDTVAQGMWSRSPKTPQSGISNLDKHVVQDMLPTVSNYDSAWKLQGKVSPEKTAFLVRALQDSLPNVAEEFKKAFFLLPTGGEGAVTGVYVAKALPEFKAAVEGAVRKAITEVDQLSRTERKRFLPESVAGNMGVIPDHEVSNTLRLASQYAYAKAILHSKTAHEARDKWVDHGSEYVREIMEKEHGLSFPSQIGTYKPIDRMVERGLETIQDDWAEYRRHLDGLDSGLRVLGRYVNKRMREMTEVEEDLGIPVQNVEGYLPKLVRRADLGDNVRFMQKGSKPEVGYAKSFGPDFYENHDPVRNVLQLLAYREEAHDIAMRSHTFKREIVRKFGTKLDEGQSPSTPGSVITLYENKKPVRYELNPEAVKAVERVSDMWTPANLEKPLAWINGLQNWWKTRVTMGRIAFHSRNIASNAIQLWVGGVDDPVSAVSRAVFASLAGYAVDQSARKRLISAVANTSTSTRGKKIARVHKSMSDRLLDLGQRISETKVTSSTGVTYLWGDLYRAAQEHGVIDRGWVGADITRDMIRDFSQSPGYRLGREIVKHSAYTLNPGSRDFILLRAGGGTGRAIENSARLAMFTDQVIKKGMDFKGAAEHTNKVMFDYSPESLTKLERKVKVMVPFYTWLRRNIPFQIESMIKRPGRYTSQYKTFRGLDRAYESERERLSEGDKYIPYDSLPSYQKRQFGVRMASSPLGDERNGSVFIWTPGLTAGDINTLTSFSGEEFLSQLTPVFKVPIELARGKRLKAAGYEQELDGLVPISPSVAWLLEKAGVEPKARVSDYDPNENTFVAPAIIPYLLEQTFPDLYQFEKLFPEALDPNRYVEDVKIGKVRPSSAKEKTKTQRLNLIPGVSGSVIRPKKQFRFNIEEAISQIKKKWSEPGSKDLPTTSKKKSGSEPPIHLGAPGAE